MESTAALDFTLLVLRVSLGLTMAAHGYNKFFGGGRIPGTARWFESMGMRPGKLHAVLAATTEVVSGLLLAAGLLTTFAGAGFVGVMLVAAWTHKHNGFFIVKSGWEYNFVLAITAVCISAIGPLRWSLDRALGIDDSLDGWVGFALSAGIGLASGIAQMAIFYRPPAPTSD
jgi:putative oxidoreductase